MQHALNGTFTDFKPGLDEVNVLELDLLFDLQS